MSTQNPIANTIDVTEFTSAPERVTKVAYFNASPAEVFAALSDHANLPQIVPGMVHVTVDRSHEKGENGEGTERTCDFGEMGKFTERIVYFDPPHAYAYSIEGPFGTTESLGLMICEAEGSSRTRLTWKQYFNHPQPERIAGMLHPAMDGVIENLTTRFGK